MKTKDKVFSDEKQPENKVSRKVSSFSRESSERDQSPITDVNSFRNEGLRTDNESSTNNPPGNFEKIQKESKYSFVVDWQIP